ncbi:MAG: hypothetical protein IAE80_21280 [Anaerolinea sp.]|nr:hypothetical protein [Anaerolinea sp.]
MKPRFDTDRSLDRIAAILLLIFVLATLFLPLAVTRYFQRQAIDAAVATDIHDEILDLQNTTEELQETVNELQAQADDREVSVDLERIDETLAEMSEQIEQIGDALGTREQTEEAPLSGAVVDEPREQPVDEPVTVQGELLTLMGWTVGLLSILTAVIWATVMILRGKRRRRPSPTVRDIW